MDTASRTSTDNESALATLVEYLRIRDGEHPNPSYCQSVPFLANVAESLGFTVSKVALDNDRIVVVASCAIPSETPARKSILLTSHMDVVPAGDESKWRHPPFAGNVCDGTIYGRGVQDMKAVGIAQLYAAARLVRKPVMKYLVDVHVAFVPDEEIGSARGMAAFVNTPQFKQLNVGIALDESVPSPIDAYIAAPDERAVWWIKMRIAGQSSGHGSALLQGTAVERLSWLLSTIYAWRRERLVEMAKLDGVRFSNDSSVKKTEKGTKPIADPSVDAALPDTAVPRGIAIAQGAVSSVNVTAISAGGEQVNRIPDGVEISLDFRVAPSQGVAGAQAVVESWAASVPGVTFETIQAPVQQPKPHVSDSQQRALRELAREIGDRAIVTGTMPGATDSRFLRAVGVPSIGFTPFKLTPPLLHDYNESLRVEEFYEGISVMERTVVALCNHLSF